MVKYIMILVNTYNIFRDFLDFCFEFYYVELFLTKYSFNFIIFLGFIFNLLPILALDR